MVRPKLWIDISVPIRNGMPHWPDDPPVHIETTFDIERGDSHTMSELTMPSHTGTHIDAPRHFLKGGAGVDQIPLDIAIGRVRVIEIADTESIKVPELISQHIRRSERVLFKTCNSDHIWDSDDFREDYVYLTNEAADFLARHSTRLVGIDYLSVGAFRGGSYVHRTLLSSGAWVIEGLDLSGVKPGRYDLICLPIRLDGGDGAPARAVIRPV